LRAISDIEPSDIEPICLGQGRSARCPKARCPKLLATALAQFRYVMFTQQRIRIAGSRRSPRDRAPL